MSDRLEARSSLPDRVYRELFDDAVDAAIVLDDDRSILAANLAAGALFGMDRAAILGQPVDAFLPDQGAQVRAAWPELLALGEAHLVHRVTRAGEPPRIVECRIRARGRRHVCVLRDVTERQAIDERLAQSEKIESVGRLAGGIAHDFNNLLTAVLGYTELLLDRAVPGGTDYGDLCEIQRAGRRASALVQQLLAFGRRQLMMPEEVDLNQVVVGVQHMLRRLIREDLTLSCELAPEPASVTVDPGRIEQVIVNLVLNARDALTAGGRIRLDVSIVPASEVRAGFDHLPPSARYVRLRVDDNGVGMSPDVRARAFEPFFTTKGLGEGAGLGLASVYGTVRQSHGVVDLASEPGRGTTVTMHFPMVEARSTEQLEGHAGRGPRTDARPPATVLLVEDEDAVRSVVRDVLRRQAIRVLEASSPALALELFAREPDIDLLLIDVVMPEMNGPALAQRFIAARPDVRILFISGYLDLTNSLAADNPNVGFLGKPFPASVLVSRVRAMLDGSPDGR